ncbi:hypothetical protein J7K99_01715, partial [bacterium]|nr:hypothetical protein [bacterium]
VGGYRYAEPTFETPQKFGLGFGGIDFRTDFAGTFLRGTDLALIVANMYEDWTLEPDSLDFLNLFGRRPLGFWRRQVATAEPPTDFSNFGTDVVVFRIARDFGFIAPALNIRVDRNQWWLPTSEISYSRFDSIYEANGLHSDWVDLGALETGIAPEINLKPFDALELGGEYLLWQYRSSIDAGNRENHDHTADSTLDITLGTQKGYLFGGQIRWSFAGGASVALYGEREHYDAMDSSQTYILPRHNDGSTGRPTLEFITPGEFDRHSFSAKIELSGKRHSLSAAGEYESAEDLYNYVGGSLKGNVQLWDDRLILRGIFALRTGKYYGDALKFSDFDGVGAAKINFWRDLWFAADVWFKGLFRKPQSSDYPGSVWKVDETIFAPYAGIVYQPKPSVEFEVSAGVRPYNVNGYYTGRSEWIYDTMRDNEISYIDALKRLSLFQGINIYAVMKF